MLALIASALLGLYLLVPVFLFEQAAQSFVRLKRHQRTRIEELAAGILTAGIPFALTSIIFWRSGGWPTSDYKLVLNSLYSEHYFDEHTMQFWASFGAVWRHQVRFLAWNYSFLLLEIGLVTLFVWQFGRLNQFSIFKRTVGKWLLNRVSEWQPLLTPFVFPPSENRRVEVESIQATAIFTAVPLRITSLIKMEIYVGCYSKRPAGFSTQGWGPTGKPGSKVSLPITGRRFLAQTCTFHLKKW